MCLASTLFHHVFVMDFPSNHIACTTSQAYQNAPTLNYFAENEDAVKTTMPWTDPQNHLSGMPRVLHDLMEVRYKQRLLVDQFIDKMGTLLDKWGIKQGNALTVQNLQEVLGDGLNIICLHLDQIKAG
ncbi:hypothetical protein ACA910_006362 [Epithemia clementina (nom. ined.)]